jgi:hypothetical protein
MLGMISFIWSRLHVPSVEDVVGPSVADDVGDDDSDGGTVAGAGVEANVEVWELPAAVLPAKFYGSDGWYRLDKRNQHTFYGVAFSDPVA